MVHRGPLWSTVFCCGPRVSDTFRCGLPRSFSAAGPWWTVDLRRPARRSAFSTTLSSLPPCHCGRAGIESARLALCAAVVASRRPSSRRVGRVAAAHHWTPSPARRRRMWRGCAAARRSAPSGGEQTYRRGETDTRSLFVLASAGWVGSWLQECRAGWYRRPSRYTAVPSPSRRGPVVVPSWSRRCPVAVPSPSRRGPVAVPSWSRRGPVAVMSHLPPAFGLSSAPSLAASPSATPQRARKQDRCAAGFPLSSLQLRTLLFCPVLAPLSSRLLAAPARFLLPWLTPAPVYPMAVNGGPMAMMVVAYNSMTVVTVSVSHLPPTLTSIPTTEHWDIIVQLQRPYHRPPPPPRGHRPPSATECLGASLREPLYAAARRGCAAFVANASFTPPSCGSVRSHRPGRSVLGRRRGSLLSVRPPSAGERSGRSGGRCTLERPSGRVGRSSGREGGRTGGRLPRLWAADTSGERLGCGRPAGVLQGRNGSWVPYKGNESAAGRLTTGRGSWVSQSAPAGPGAVAGRAICRTRPTGSLVL